MAGLTPRALYAAFAWHARGVFATEANRRVGFRAKELLQPAEFRARRELAAKLAADVPAAERIAGYRVLSPWQLPDVTEVCEIGRAIVAEASLDIGVANGNKKFSRFRLALEEQRLALLRVGLDRRLIAAAAAKMGVLPVILEADYFCSFPVEPPFTKSQLWHCDDDAAEVLKIFIYCDDVTPDDGPFELVDAPASERVRGAVGYRYAGRRYRVSDAAMARNVDEPREVVSIVGGAGTAFAVDTVHCFHRGSRITKPGRSRVVGMICYCPPSATHMPHRLAGRTAPMLSFSRHFSDDVQLAVLGAPVASRWF